MTIDIVLHDSAKIGRDKLMARYGRSRGGHPALAQHHWQMLCGELTAAGGLPPDALRDPRTVKPPQWIWKFGRTWIRFTFNDHRVGFFSRRRRTVVILTVASEPESGPPAVPLARLPHPHRPGPEQSPPEEPPHEYSVASRTDAIPT